MDEDLDYEALLEAPLNTENKPETSLLVPADGNGTNLPAPQTAPDAAENLEPPAEDQDKKRKRSKSPRRSSRSHRHGDKRSQSPRSRSSRSPKRKSKSPKRRRTRSRSPRSSRHSRDSGRDRERERRREREQQRERERERERKRREERAGEPEKVLSKEDEAERDSRTVFAHNLPIRATESELFEFFGRVGKVRDIRLISDRNSRKSKGFGYVEYYAKETVPAALQLSGTQFKGQTVLVQATQAEKNRAAAQTTTTTTTLGPTRLYVGSLHLSVTEQDLREVFEPFGDLELVTLHIDPETGRSQGFAYVQYRSPEDAKKALQHCNGLDLAGRQLKVGLVTDTKADIGADVLDDEGDDSGGMVLNAQSRALLMAKLQQRGNPVAGVPGLVPSALPGMPPLAPALRPVQAPAPSAVLTPTPCILLKNMFDPATETEPDFDADIAEDVGEECSRHGKVLHIRVLKESAGLVYVKMDSTESARKVQATLNHRWFAGKMITAEFVAEATYNAMHGLA